MSSLNVNVNFQKKEEYVFEKAVPEDYQAILRLLQESYYLEEPTCSELGITSDLPELDDIILDSLKMGFTVVAKTKSDRKVVGCQINECVYIDSPEEKEKYAANTKHWGIKYLMKFYAFIQRYPNIFDRFIVDSLFEVNIYNFE